MYFFLVYNSSLLTFKMAFLRVLELEVDILTKSNSRKAWTVGGNFDSIIISMHN